MRETIETQYAIQGFFGKYRPLSNFDTSPFEINGVVFKSGEHAFQYFKTNDLEWKQKILDAEKPSDARRLGRQCPMCEDWEKIKVCVMINISESKYRQNQHLKDLLLSTGFKYLEETNDWNDTFWGVCNGKGRNTLGKALMLVRGRLMSVRNVIQ